MKRGLVKMSNTNITIEDVMVNLLKGIYNYENGTKKVLYEYGHVFDEDKSVKWNREKVTDENNGIKDYNKKVTEGIFRGMVGFEEDVKLAISNETGLDLEKASHVYSKAWEDGHSGGKGEVLNETLDLISLIKDIL